MTAHRLNLTELSVCNQGSAPIPWPLTHIFLISGPVAPLSPICFLWGPLTLASLLTTHQSESSRVCAEEGLSPLDFRCLSMLLYKGTDFEKLRSECALDVQEIGEETLGVVGEALTTASAAVCPSHITGRHCPP